MASATRQDSWTRTALLAFLLVSLGQMLMASDGHYSPQAVHWLLWSAALGLLAFVAPPLPALERLGLCGPAAILFGGLALQFSQLLTHPPGIYLRPAEGWSTFLQALAVAGVFSGSLLFAKSTWARIGTGAAAFCFLAAAFWVLRASPRPTIDVYLFHEQSIFALLHGRNPYGLTFPNIYGHTQFYGPEVADTRTVFIGFPYPPFSLLLATLGVLATGDYRYTFAVGLVIAAACIVALRPDRVGALTAATLLFTPRALFVLEQGWTEPFGIALLGLVLVAAVRTPRLLWLALGAFFAWKQTTVVLLPLTTLLIPQPFSWRAWGRLILPALLLTALLTLPLALLDLHGFWRSVVWFQTAQPFRSDALSIPAALLALGLTPLPVMPTMLVLTAAAIGWMVWKAPRTPYGFAVAVTLVLGVFFAFSKQSFCNYWFLVLGASALAVAAGRTATEPDVATDPR